MVQRVIGSAARRRSHRLPVALERARRGVVGAVDHGRLAGSAREAIRPRPIQVSPAGLQHLEHVEYGAFLTEEEIRDAVDSTLPALVTTRTPRPTARIGLDLGLVKDRTAIVATDIMPDGRLIVLHVDLIQGTRLAP